MPKVSIVVPSYNRAEFIPATLDSIITQTFKDFELIFVDDGSTDDTETILAHYASHDKRIKYIKQKNSERAVARSQGMKRAEGEYIALVDSDDLWYARKLEKQLEIFERHPDLALCYASVNRIDFDGNRLKSAPRQHQGESGYVLFELLMRNFIPSVTPMFRKDIFNKVGDQNTEFIPYEDWDFWLRISLHGKFFHISEPLGDYRLHPGQSVKNVKAEHIEKVTLAVLKNNTDLTNAQLQKYLQTTNTSQEAWQKISDQAFSEAHLRLAYWYIVSDKLDIAKQHLEKSKNVFDYRWWGLKSAHGLSRIAPEPVKKLLGAFH